MADLMFFALLQGLNSALQLFILSVFIHACYISLKGYFASLLFDEFLLYLIVTILYYSISFLALQTLK
jgi:hypothetical protein